MNKEVFTHAEVNVESIQKEARFCGMNVRHFTVAAIAVLAVLFFSKSYIIENWIFPLLYPLLCESIEWPIRAIVLLWYVCMLGIGYWAMDKRRRMQAAQAELDRRQADTKPQQ